MEPRGKSDMIIKSNTPLSDNELRRVKEAFEYDENPDAALYTIFPRTKHRIEGNVIYIGNPSWDLTQEIQL